MYSRPTRTFHAHKLQTPAPSSTLFSSDFAVKTRTKTPPSLSAPAVLSLVAPPSRRPLDHTAPSIPTSPPSLSCGLRCPLHPDVPAFAVLWIAPPPPSLRPCPAVPPFSGSRSPLRPAVLRIAPPLRPDVPAFAVLWIAPPPTS
ncbi:hypothetical protein GUJ93_ZPchr0006g44702 [Zizania palustris]|uniref:Uncharacterized protein n=1 Tax=Zizania palustris TaxID=103762 RepID=A0A8J5T1N5_ZIZPA|nr:hypothetical protein GUJ93_ZPchr0006g44702 [Zizania palustris]